ncbi:MAG: SDR family oxidoreductase [Nitrospinaceae bacterium]|jgi:NAD(P)-dependent dehydrogenase (short-subunit alcohol dehydrogenase family)|nr:SDR family oxidoreductase [Nitrospinaceae bacterium]MBT5368217.1 SDR family oxidoreductase [Nitrospinaceae bacterium]MBT6395765.1 SDR family oxidoreductase [Nitrospinaceae bacterium]
MNLKDRVALITGGSLGIGKATVTKFLDEGAKVAFCARNEQEIKKAVAEFEKINPDVLSVRADITDKEQVANMVEAATRRFGNIDILVNNAGIYGPIGPSWEVDLDLWEEAMRINLFGTMKVCQAVVPLMIKAGGGKIINIAGGGAAGPFPRYSAYASSKAALVRVTENLSIELSDHNIQVNSIAPGFVVTRLHQQTMDAGDNAGAEFLQKTRKEMEEGGVDPSVPAALAAYLASPRGDAITGKFISAIWDGWAGFEKHLEDFKKSDVYTLRRIVPAERGMDWK